MQLPWTFPPKPLTMYLSDLCNFDPKLWFANVKYDGHRAHPIKDERGLLVRSRHNKPLQVSPIIMEGLAAIGLPDGTMLDSEWNARRASKTEELFIFDVLWWDGEWIGDEAFESRYDRLRSLNLKPPIHLVENVQDDFVGLMGRIIGDFKTEGLVLKRRGYVIPRLLRESKDIPAMVKIKWRDGPDGNTQTIKLENGLLVSI